MTKPLALVTGGASGMGLATVERLANDGFHVVLVDRDPDLSIKESTRLKQNGLDVQCEILDLTNEDLVRTLIKNLPPINALVNNAGIFDERKFLEVTSEDFRRVYEINLISVATMTQEVAKRMPDGGRIVNISSKAAVNTVMGSGHYAAAKAAVNSLTVTYAKELGPRIRVNCIMPGAVPTEIMMKALRLEDDDLPKLEKMLRLPMRRLGTPEDLGQAVLYFVSPASSWVTGQVIGIDGGL